MSSNGFSHKDLKGTIKTLVINGAEHRVSSFDFDTGGEVESEFTYEFIKPMERVTDELIQAFRKKEAEISIPEYGITFTLERISWDVSMWNSFRIYGYVKENSCHWN